MSMRPANRLLAFLIASVSAASWSYAEVGGSAEFVAPGVRTSTPPVIDGQLSESCWQRASRLSDFRLIHQNRRARQQTACSFLWDDQALYIGVTCQEKALEHAVQTQHLVKAKVKERDGHVFGDDCVEVFLSPEPSKGYFHLAVNAAGTQYDARGTDAKWDARWQAVTKMGDGAWTLEMAIPFAELGIAPPRPGDRWRFNLSREEKPEDENSSLCGVQGAFHSPEQFGSLVFTGPMPALRSVRLAGDGVGRANASVVADVTEGMPGFTVRLEALTAGKAAVVAQKAWSGPPSTPEVKLASEQPVASARVSMLVGNAVVLTTLWETIAASVAEVPHVLEAHECEVRVFVRGRQVDELKAGGKSTKPLALLRGVNVIALHCKATGGKPWVRAHAPSVDGESFAGWLARHGFEDSADLKLWRTAKASGNGFWATDAAAREVTLRRVLYLPEERPRNWPGMADFTLPAGTTQVFYPMLDVPADVPLQDYRVRLDIPARLKVVSVDEVGGAAGQVLLDRVVGPRRHVEVGIENPYEGGMDLSIRWADATKTTIAYMPAVSVAGTCDWRRVRGTLTSPSNTRYVHPLLIKWQNRGTRGEAWFDNLVVRKKGTKDNMLAVGTFDEPWWQEKEHKTYKLVEVERDGQKTFACRLVGTDKNEKGQDALWVGEPVPVEPDTEYEFEALVKCENVRSGKVQPRLALAVRHEGGALKADTIRFGFVAGNGYVTEVQASVTLAPLSALLKKRPKESRIIPCYYSDGFNAATSEVLVQNVWDAGIGGIYGGHNRVTKALQPKGLRVIWSFRYNAWQLFPAPDWKDQHPDRLAVSYDGKQDKGRICPTYALQEGSEFLPLLREWVKTAVKGCGYDEIDCDYEVPVVDPPTFCFCSRCLEAFRKRESLPADEKLTAEVMVKKHRDAWTAFRCRQNAEMIGLLARFIRDTEPRIRVSTYSGFHNKHTREHYGVDWTLLRDKIDEGIAGYNGNRERLVATAQALAPKPFIGGEMYYLSDGTSETGPIRREGWKMRLLRTYINSGCHGVLIWYLPPMDGSAFHQTSQAAAIIADFEDFFRRGQRADDKVSFASTLPADDFAAFEKDGQALLVLFNPTPAVRTVEGVAVKGLETLTTSRYDDRLGRLASEAASLKEVRIEPRDAAVLLLRR